MKSLVVLLDSAAPSFCFYPSAPAHAKRAIDAETFSAAVRYAETHDLELQIIAGDTGVSEDLRERARTRPHVCYVPCSAPLQAEDVPVVDLQRSAAIDALEAGRHTIALLRIPREGLAGLAGAWRELSARVHRVVLVLAELERYQEHDLARYRQALTAISETLEQRYADDALIEFNVISDRLILRAPAECAAGIDHITVAPSGELYLCPAFATDAANALGALPGPPRIANARLLSRACAPICSDCDAFQCRRCVYLNQETTLELNTPPWQACRAAHVEREITRQLLERMHSRGRMKAIDPLPAIDYDDPFEKLPNAFRMPRKRETIADDDTRDAIFSLRGQPTPVSSAAPKGKVLPFRRDRPKMKEPSMAENKIVGKVSAEERDEIRALFLRKSALTELFLSLSKLDEATLNDSPLYEKVLKDMGDTTAKFQQWWDRKGAEHGWEARPGGSWNIDFESCEITLA